MSKNTLSEQKLAQKQALLEQKFREKEALAQQKFREKQLTIERKAKEKEIADEAKAAAKKAAVDKKINQVKDEKVPAIETGLNTRSRGHQFTLNNYTDEIIEIVREFCNTKCDYAIFGYEVGAQGTPHLQGYVYHNNKIAKGTIIKTFQKKGAC